jgi:DNA topoisomerase-1
VGTDPTTGLAIVIKDGSWGPYVTDGVTNASLRTADDPATLSVERASDLLSERRAKEALEGPSPKKAAKRAVKKAPAKRAAATKTPARSKAVAAR